MINKLSTLLLFSLFSILTTKSQTTNAWGNFGQQIDIRNSIKDTLKLEAKIKSITNDTSCIARLYISFLNKKSKLINSYYEVTNHNPVENNWQTHSLKVKIPKGSKSAIIGGQHTNKGLHYYDDFKLVVISQNKNTPIENLLQNSSFEEDSIQKTWEYIYQPNPWFKESITTDESSSGKKSLRVDGTHYSKIIQYGNNESAGKKIKVNGINLYYEVYGNGEPLLLLHGNGQNIGSFSQQIYEFKNYYTVYAVDTRGQGKSTENGIKYSYDLFAADINAFLDSLKLKNVNIIGWSDGGNTGLILAMKHPEKVKALVTMGANIFINNSVVKKSVFRTLKRGVTYFEKDTSYSSQNKVKLLKLLQTEPNYSFEDLKKIQCPVLVIAGQKDIIKETHTKGIANSISKGRLYIAPNETHFFPKENKTLFNKIVLDYLKSEKINLN